MDILKIQKVDVCTMLRLKNSVNSDISQTNLHFIKNVVLHLIVMISKGCSNYSSIKGYDRIEKIDPQPKYLCIFLVYPNLLKTIKGQQLMF